MQPKYSFAFLSLGLALLYPARAEAVRPFVTDDARIAARGQVEGETWLELSRPNGRVLPVYNALLNLVPLEWLEFGLSGGIGWDVDNSITLVNPGFQTKFLFVRPMDNEYPGLSFVMGTIFPAGRGSASSEEQGFYFIVPTTLSLFDGGVEVHANIGWIGARLPDNSFEHRPFWGLGADIALGHPDIRAIAEGFAGDPSDTLGPKLAFQAGGRWIASDHINVDLALGAAPRDHAAWDKGFDTSVQVGLRFLIDAFTGSGPVDPEGGKGMF